VTVVLTEEERGLLYGSQGDAGAMAMRIVVAAAELLGARSLVRISSAHIDGCLHHGDGGVEFAEALVRGGGHVAVPTTLNVGALDLLHPDVVHADAHKTDMARRQMEAYVAMGAEPTFTCAPYQVGHEPGLGDQVAWGESNAIAFVNSVLGARTERYGDFLDACCALTGRAPLHGLHLTENRRATVVVDATGVPDALKTRDVFFPVLGTWLGLMLGDEVAAIEGLPVGTSRDQLKALGAAAASTGAVALFHVVGVTPEAPTTAVAVGIEDAAPSRPTPPGWVSRGMPALPRRIRLTSDGLRASLARLSTAEGVKTIDAVAVGSPHFSLDEFEQLARLVHGVSDGPDEAGAKPTGPARFVVPFYVCTARDTLAQVEERGWAEPLRAAGVEIVVDTCVVVTPILPAAGGVLMTNSGKFAHYGPSNTGYEVVYGSLEDCVASARSGRLERDEAVWTW
jgi:predicted aconitase